MAESEGKSGISDEPSTISKESVVAAKENETTNSTSAVVAEEDGKSWSSSMKQSWSGWFQKVNDAVMAMAKDEEETADEGTTTTKKKEEDEAKEEVKVVDRGEEEKTIVVDEEGQEKGSSSWGAWGSSFLQQAKEKTMNTFEMVKKDLTEFTDVVQNETAQIVSATATTIRDRAPHLVETIVGTVNSVLVEDTTRGEEDAEIPITADTAAALCGNRSQARLYAIQSDPETYIGEPDGAPELFDDWLDHVFNLEDKKEEISRLLVTNPSVRNLFARLVPSEISNTMFWQRYFYRLHQFDLDEARRRALLQREENAASRVTTENPHLSWGDESDFDDHHELMEKAETESFCDLAKDDVASIQSDPPTEKQQSPLCGRQPPEGVGAIPKSIDGQRRDSCNVEMKDVEESPDKQKPLEADVCSVSSFEPLPRNDGESGSPTDKKSDDWVEWEGNENSS